MSCLNEAFAESIIARLPEAFSMIALLSLISLQFAKMSILQDSLIHHTDNRSYKKSCSACASSINRESLAQMLCIPFLLHIFCTLALQQSCCGIRYCLYRLPTLQADEQQWDADLRDRQPYSFEPRYLRVCNMDSSRYMPPGGRGGSAMGFSFHGRG